MTTQARTGQRHTAGKRKKGEDKAAETQQREERTKKRAEGGVARLCALCVVCCAHSPSRRTKFAVQTRRRCEAGRGGAEPSRNVQLKRTRGQKRGKLGEHKGCRNTSRWCGDAPRLHTPSRVSRARPSPSSYACSPKRPARALPRPAPPERNGRGVHRMRERRRSCWGRGEGGCEGGRRGGARGTGRPESGSTNGRREGAALMRVLMCVDCVSVCVCSRCEEAAK